MSPVVLDRSPARRTSAIRSTAVVCSREQPEPPALRHLASALPGCSVVRPGHPDGHRRDVTARLELLRTSSPSRHLHAAVDAFPNKNVTVKINEVDHNTFQENITTYLQNPDDVIPWFAGYRMRFFAAQGLLGPIDDVWEPA